MIVWGGYREFDGNTNTGARYDPIGDAWAPTSEFNAPLRRNGFTTVWTGSEMIVWGGRSSGSNVLSTGGRYDPEVNLWTPTSTSGSPGARQDHTAVWTGSEMIVWGGRTGSFPWDPFVSGGRYDPAADSWTPTSTHDVPEARYDHSAVWTGERMIVWGGENAGHDVVDTGALYDPVEDGWVPTSTDGAPEPRRSHTVVWTGNQMVVWGGADYFPVGTGGGSYIPRDDSWDSTTEVDAPSVRSGHTAIWTGERMIVWDGAQDAKGGSYDPDGVDEDGDGFGCALDCDDQSEGIWAAPGEVGGLRFAANKITLEWIAVAAAAGPGTVYDIVRGVGTGLPVGTGVDRCLESGYPAGGGTGTIQLDDTDSPATGVLFWYLVRPTNGCGTGTYGSTSAGTPRSTDACN
jgi:hypothetical protein